MPPIRRSQQSQALVSETDHETVHPTLTTGGDHERQPDSGLRRCDARSRSSCPHDARRQVRRTSCKRPICSTLISFISLFNGSMIPRLRSVRLLLERQTQVDDSLARRRQGVHDALELVAGAPPRVLTGMHPPEKGPPRLRHARAQVTRGDCVETALELLQAYALGRWGLGINANPELVPVFRNSGSRRWVVETEHWVCQRVIEKSRWSCPRAQPTPRLLLGSCADGTDPGNTHGPESLDTDVESSHAGRFIPCTRGSSA